jgi:hypothetical protein
VLGLPTTFQQTVDRFVGRLDRVLGRGGDEAHIRTVATTGVHPRRRQRSERLVHLLGVAEGSDIEAVCCGEGVGRPPQASHSLSQIGQLQPLVLPQPSQT